MCTSEDDVISKLREEADERGLFEQEFPVVLIDNGGFQAAAVCWCRSEVERLYDLGDPRPMRWYMVAAKDLKEILSKAEFETFIKIKGPFDAKMRFAPGIPEEYL